MLYSLTNKTDKEVGGVFPQAISLTDGDVIKSFIKESFPDVKNHLIYELDNEAKLTDSLSQTAIASGGVLINDRLVEIITNYRVMNYKLYPANIFKYNSSVGTYNWLQIRENLVDEIDYEKSVFYETMYSFEENEIQFNSYRNYEQIKEEKGIFWGSKIKRIYLKKNSKLKEYDLFSILPFDSTICVSQRLVDELQASKITGIEIEEYDKILFH